MSDTVRSIQIITSWRIDMRSRCQIILTCILLCLCVSDASAGRFFGEDFLPRRPAPKIAFNKIPDGFRSDIIVLKFREGTDVRLRGDRLVSLAGADTLAAGNILDDPGISIDRYFSRSESELDADRISGQAMGNRELADLNLYFKLTLDASTDAADLLQRLNALPEIETVYPQPIPMPAFEPLPTPNWQPDQGYLNPAPQGIDAYFSWGIPGSKGESIRVCDIEGNWVFSHEDLSKAHGDIHLGGALILDPMWYNHGTAVLGEIAADSNGVGVTGIAFGVSLNTVSIGTMSNADAIDLASDNIDAGDIILIELQEAGPNGGNYVPIEFYQAAFDAISAASANGRIVVEAGANGHQDLDDSYWYGNLFDPDYRHSGAILVGAGTPTSHSPEWFTSYGERLDLQGWGSEIYTLGYGDLYSEGDTAHYYTADFGGTSGASPIVVGAVAALRGAYEHAYGTVLTRDEIVDILQSTGTPQGEPTSQNIGPLPDLRAAMESVLAIFNADGRLGKVPFTVAFTGEAPDTPIEWIWDFGDGDSAFTENPTHVYDTPGVFDISLTVETPSGDYSMNRPECIVALLDSLNFSNERGLYGQSVGVSVTGRNDVEIDRIILPFKYAGDAGLAYDSFSLAGTRCEYFEDVSVLLVNPGARLMTLMLEADGGGGSLPLPPGSGEIIRLYFTVGSQTYGASSSVDSMSALTFSLKYRSLFGSYTPYCQTGSITVSGPDGDADASGAIDIDDVVYLIQYIFAGGPEPLPYSVGDADCSGEVDIDDAVYLIAYIFGGGPPPGCP